jgi:hypothetical protein
MAHPGAGALGVRPEEQRRLSRGERERLGEGRRSGGKVRYCASPISGPVPVGAMFVLRRTSTGSDVVLRRLDAVDPLLLLGSTFNLSVCTPERLCTASSTSARAWRTRCRS